MTPFAFLRNERSICVRCFTKKSGLGGMEVALNMIALDQNYFK